MCQSVDDVIREASRYREAGHMAQWTQPLFLRLGERAGVPITKLGGVVQLSCDPSAWEVEAGISGQTG